MYERGNRILQRGLSPKHWDARRLYDDISSLWRELDIATYVFVVILITLPRTHESDAVYTLTTATSASITYFGTSTFTNVSSLSFTTGTLSSTLPLSTSTSPSQVSDGEKKGLSKTAKIVITAVLSVVFAVIVLRYLIWWSRRKSSRLKTLTSQREDPTMKRSSHGSRKSSRSKTPTPQMRVPISSPSSFGSSPLAP